MPFYPPEQETDDLHSNPWQRLLRCVTQALGGSTDEGFNFAAGMDFGFAIAIRHPEYAVAMRRATQKESMKGHIDTEKLVDDFVKAVPIMKGEAQ
ncbi:hypothetical protein LCGC14_2541620 [marine sediment metagenome]|uniref:Uncharacterized protein n=1 Tax=marine sediment metagenome TaxID=412755 RepID=A0A0F9DIM6_9ZZZZ